MRRWLREPALHFVVLGAGLFALHAAVAEPEETTERAPIVISEDYLEGLRARHRRRAGRDADDDALVAAYARDEALHREALRLGLDRGDAIVRRRMVQKMELLLRTTSAPAPPSDEAIAAFHAAHPERYRAAETLDLELRWFSRDRRADAEADARAAIASGAPVGDPFLLGDRFEGLDRAQARTRLGPALAEAAFEATGDGWVGPIATPRGVFALRVTARRPGRRLPLSEVRAQVARDVAEAAEERAFTEAVDALVAEYRVERPAS